MQDFALTIMGNDWIVIAFVALVMFLGTKRLPDASRKLGKIVGEFNRTKNTVSGEMKKATEGFGIPVNGPVTTERQKLEIMAKTLGIDSAGKTDDDLRNQISSRFGMENTGKGPDKSGK